MLALYVILSEQIKFFFFFRGGFFFSDGSHGNIFLVSCHDTREECVGDIICCERRLFNKCWSL